MNATDLAVVEVDHAGVLPGPWATRGPSDGSREQRRRVLVAAVLRPEEREDRELEVVRVALQQLSDSVELPVGETERSMERLFGDRSQKVIVPGLGQAASSASATSPAGAR